jgi:CubicO group peptidase (beta-lactamase class C family)
MKKTLFLLFLPVAFLSGQLYFPPNIGGQWDTLSHQSLHWCPSKIAELDSFLIASNTKSFLILKNGKMAHERYFGSYTQDSLWYWASAAKTLTAFLVGKAQAQGHLSILDSSSKHLGQGWTSLTVAQEGLITIEDQLQMTTGLEYQGLDLDCTIDTCLRYRNSAGNQWYYHNAPYKLLHDVIRNATGSALNQYTQQTLAASIGFRGIWFDHLYFSKARDMARFGLLLLNQGKWNGQIVLPDTSFLNMMLGSSQNLNLSYGYLTWLNGKSSYIQPGLPWVFSGAIIPSAPADLFMAAGKNDQRIYVLPSQGLVVVRQGNAADSSTLALSAFDDKLWQFIKALNCNGIGLRETKVKSYLYPNPASDQIRLPQGKTPRILLNIHGQRVVPIHRDNVLEVGHLAQGTYVLFYEDGSCSRLVVIP